MQYKDGADVFSVEGEKVGEIDRVVVDPGDGKVTHVVVRSGFIFTEDRVVPVDMVDRASDDEVHLNATKDHLDELPEFLEVNFIPIGSITSEEEIIGRAPAATEMYWYPMAGTTPLMWGGGYWGMAPESVGYYYPQRVRTEMNIPEGHVALEEGANVIGKDGEKIGDLTRVIAQSDDNKVTHLVVTKGLLNREKKLIPAHWISRVKDDTVQLKVDAKFVDKLKEYKED